MNFINRDTPLDKPVPRTKHQFTNRECCERFFEEKSLDSFPKSLRDVNIPVENLANLIYLIGLEADRPEKVREYTALAAAQMARLILMIQELYDSAL